MERAYDWRHRRKRAALLPLAYGKPCPLCGQTMHEWQRLHLDHTDPRDKDAGLPGDRITHARCNQRGLARLDPPTGSITAWRW